VSGAERYLPPESAEGLKRLREESPSPILAYSRVLEVSFPAANVKRDVQHGLSATPTGVIVLLAIGGAVRGSDITSWSPTLAYLQADSANTRARVVFVVTEDPINA
jgi:hypothetical protein